MYNTKKDDEKFIRENIEKTRILRLKWNVLHKDTLKDHSTFKSPEKGHRIEDINKMLVEKGMELTNQDFITSGRNRRHIHPPVPIPGVANLKKVYTIPAVGLGSPKEDSRLARPDTDLSIDPKMRPVDPEHKKILYQAFPGKRIYLNSRKQIKPEDKYYFEECTGWQYGWRLKDSSFGNPRGPVYGKVNSITVGCLSRSGVHPDPSNYKQLDVIEPQKCVYK